MSTKPFQEIGFDIVGPLAVDLAGGVSSRLNRLEAELIFAIDKFTGSNDLFGHVGRYEQNALALGNH